MRLPPGYTYYRIVIVRRMAEIIFNQGFIISQFTTPYQCIGQGAFTNGFIFFTIKYGVYPVQVFTVMDVSYFSTVDIKGVDGFTGMNVIPVDHYVFFHSSHLEGTILNKYQPGAGPLFLFSGYLVATHVLVVIIPTCYVGLLMLFATE